jgi:hypothetical protein
MQPTASFQTQLQMPPSSVSVSLTPLYGILVSHKSFLLGLRALAREFHALMLTGRILTPRLPPELRNRIAEELAELDREVVRRVWEGGSNWEEKVGKFAMPIRPGRPADCERKAVVEMVRCLPSLLNDVLIAGLLTNA